MISIYFRITFFYKQKVIFDVLFFAKFYLQMSSLTKRRNWSGSHKSGFLVHICSSHPFFLIVDIGGTRRKFIKTVTLGSFSTFNRCRLFRQMNNKFWNGRHAIPMQIGLVFTKIIIPEKCELNTQGGDLGFFFD